MRTETFRAALEELAKQNKVTFHGELVKKAGTEITLTPEEARAKQQIEQAFAKAGLAVPSVKEVLTQLAIENSRAEKILQILLREKVLVRVSPELIFHRNALALFRPAAKLQKIQRRTHRRTYIQGPGGRQSQIRHPFAGVPGPPAVDAAHRR